MVYDYAAYLLFFYMLRGNNVITVVVVVSPIFVYTYALLAIKFG